MQFKGGEIKLISTTLHNLKVQNVNEYANYKQLWEDESYFREYEYS